MSQPAGIGDPAADPAAAFATGAATVPGRPDPAVQPVTSAYPPSGAPEYGYRSAGGRVALLVLAVVALLLLVATGVSSTLYVQQRAETDKANTALVQRNKQVSQQAAQLSQARKDLDRARSQLDSAKSDSQSKQKMVDQLTGCLNSVRDLLTKTDLTNLNNRLAEVRQACGSLF
jgi:uncharacterized protein HemX